MVNPILTDDEKALFAALCDKPSDVLNRAAYADWLEENGKLDDREPMQYMGGLFAWMYGGLSQTVWHSKSVLPWPLFGRLKDYKVSGSGCLYYATREAAMEALRKAVAALRTPPV